MVTIITILLPEAVYCCYTRTTLFTKFFTCLYDQSLRLLSYHQALYLMLSEIQHSQKHCPRLFIVVLIVYQIVYMFL